MAEKTYHHGDLRKALLTAGEAELRETGIESFSLRKVARRAEVSHAAPTHHFKDIKGMLTALGVVGHERFLACMLHRQKIAEPDPASQLAAAGLGYVDFAERHNALFKLIFSSAMPDRTDPDFFAAGERTFSHLQVCVAALHPDRAQDYTTVFGAWAITHGIADLLSSGRMMPIGNLPAADRDAAISRILIRSFLS